MTPIEQAKAALESVEATLKNRGEEWTRDGINYISEALTALSTIEGSGEPVSFRPSVRWFAEQMELALQRNDRKGGWSNCSDDFLWQRLGSEREELRYAMFPDDPSAVDKEQVVAEAADVANFAMMIADNHGPRIGHSRSAAHPSPSLSVDEVWPYLGHKEGCRSRSYANSMISHAPISQRTCTCGLDELRSRLTKAAKP